MKFGEIPSGGGGFTLHPEGAYAARLYKIISLGIHEKTYPLKPGQTVPDTREVSMFMFYYESSVRIEEGKAKGLPYSLNKWMEFSSSDKGQFRKAVAALHGRSAIPDDRWARLEMKDLLGKVASLTVGRRMGKNGKEQEEIVAVNLLMAGVQVPDPVNPPVYLSLDPKEFDMRVYEAQPDWIKTQILKAIDCPPQLREPVEQTPSLADMEDDIPF